MGWVTDDSRENRLLNIDEYPLSSSHDGARPTPRRAMLALAALRVSNSKEIEMSSLTSRSMFEELFRDFAPGYYIRPVSGQVTGETSAVIEVRTEVREDAAGFTLLADLPGVKKEDIHVSIDANVVTLRAELKREPSAENGGDAAAKFRVLRSERQYGPVSRSFALPNDVDEANARAKYENGVLTLTLPKKAAASARRLTVE
jgi:HSP20 family protein